MGDNEAKLVEGYLELQRNLNESQLSGNSHREGLIKAKMEGIVFAYETYVSEHWATFERLLERYAYYNR